MPIRCPEAYPEILENFTKAAIRTQPPDILSWSAAYFDALESGAELPIKKRVEAPAPGLTPGLIALILSKFEDELDVTPEQIEEEWEKMGLPIDDFRNIIRSGPFQESVNLMRFIAMTARYMGRGSIGPSLRIACLILTKDEEGGANSIPLDTFREIYEFMAKVFGEKTLANFEIVMPYILDQAEKQDGMVKPRNFLHPDCPSLS